MNRHSWSANIFLLWKFLVKKLLSHKLWKSKPSQLFAPQLFWYWIFAQIHHNFPSGTNWTISSGIFCPDSKATSSTLAIFVLEKAQILLPPLVSTPDCYLTLLEVHSQQSLLWANHPCNSSWLTFGMNTDNQLAKTCTRFLDTIRFFDQIDWSDLTTNEYLQFRF